MNCLSSSEKLSPSELQFLDVKRSRNEALPLPSSHSLVGLVVCSFIPQTGSLRDPDSHRSMPCQEDTAPPPLPAPANHWGSSSHPHRRSRCPHMKHETGRKLGSKRCTRCRRRPSLCSAQLGMEENCGLSVCQHPHSPGPGMGIRGRSCP